MSLEDVALLVVLLGGYAVALLCAIAGLLPWLRGIPRRGLLIVAGLVPTVVLGYMLGLELMMAGRSAKTLLLISPIALSAIPPLRGVIDLSRQSPGSPGPRRLYLAYCALLMAAVLWALWIAWMAIHRGFMGAQV